MGVDDKRWARLAAESQFTELRRLREQAGDWRTGPALTGLLTAVLIIKGPGGLNGLADPARSWVCVLLASALTMLLTGSALGARAAYGTPGPRTPITGERLRAWTRDEVRRLRTRLVLSSVLFVAGIALMAAAVGVTWLASERKAADLVVVVTTAGPTCGRLVSGDAQGVLISTGPENAPEITPLSYATIRYIAPVPSCR